MRGALACEAAADADRGLFFRWSWACQRQVGGHNDHGHTLAGHVLLQGQRQVLAQALLGQQALGHQLGEARELAEADDGAAGWHVRNVAAAVEGEQRVLARGRKLDVAHQDDALAALVHDGLVEQGLAQHTVSRFVRGCEAFDCSIAEGYAGMPLQYERGQGRRREKGHRTAVQAPLRRRSPHSPCMDLPIATGHL